MTGFNAALLDRRGLLRLGGVEARSFLEALVTNHIESVAAGQGIYTALLTPQGKFLFDFFVVADGENLLLDCDGARATELVKRLGFYKLRAKVTIEDISAILGVAAVWDAGATALPGIVFSDPRLLALGKRIILPKDNAKVALIAAGATMVRASKYEQHRIELGVGDSAWDFEPDRSFPLELNLDVLNGIDFKKGCFIGQEVTSRVKRRSSVRKRLLPCRVTGAIPAPHTPVTGGTREVGMVFSGDASSERVLALLRLDLIKGAVLESGGALLVMEPPEWLASELEKPVDAES